jgi:hypothetical protein
MLNRPHLTDQKPRLDILRCSVRGCQRPVTYKCKACSDAHYCSTACQDAHWHEGGHGETCNREASGVAFSEKLSDLLRDRGLALIDNDRFPGLYWARKSDADGVLATRGPGKNDANASKQHSFLDKNKVKRNFLVGKSLDEVTVLAQKMLDTTERKDRLARAARAAAGPYPPPSLRVATLFPGAPAAEPAAAPGTPVVVGTPGWEADAAAMLLHHGVLVLRDPELVAGQIAIKDAFNDAIYGMPEFKRGYAARAYADLDDTRFVPGGFSALNHASSFHNPFVRRLREAAMARVAPVAAAITGYTRDPDEWVFEQAIDRMLFRAPNIKPGSETWHMDLPELPKNATDAERRAILPPKDEKLVFGGWYSVGGEQAFSCWPRSHLHSKERAVGGFAKLDADARWIAQTNKVVIDTPPGHILLFDESIVHEVLGGGKKKAESTRRLFLGWTLRKGTPSMPPLLPNTETVITTQGIASLKSGQVPQFYPVSQQANLTVRMYPQLRKYSDEAIVPALVRPWPTAINSNTYAWDLDADGGVLPGHFVVDGVDTGFSAQPAPPGGIPFTPVLPPIDFPSLQNFDGGRHMYPAYTASERLMYRPQREWVLYNSVDFIATGNTSAPGGTVRVKLPGTGDADMPYVLE